VDPNASIEENLKSILEKFCDSVHISIPVNKTNVESTLERMYNVGYLDTREYISFKEYVNRDDD
jgi:hypothetical protein